MVVANHQLCDSGTCLHSRVFPSQPKSYRVRNSKHTHTRRHVAHSEDKFKVAINFFKTKPGVAASYDFILQYLFTRHTFIDASAMPQTEGSNENVQLQVSTKTHSWRIRTWLKVQKVCWGFVNSYREGQDSLDKVGHIHWHFINLCRVEVQFDIAQNMYVLNTIFIISC